MELNNFFTLIFFVFDVWFFLQRLQSNINETIILERTGKSVAEYAE